MYLPRCLSDLPDATLEYGCLVELPVVGAQLANDPVMTVGLGSRIATDATGINRMILRKPCLGTGMLGDVAVRLVARNCISEHFFKSNEYRLPHDAHYGSILQGSAATDRLGQLDFTSMVLRVAFRTQGDEVVRGITSGLPALDVVDAQLIVLGLPLAALAFVPVPE